jgi:hypothetical protein
MKEEDTKIRYTQHKWYPSINESGAFGEAEFWINRLGHALRQERTRNETKKDIQCGI